MSHDTIVIGAGVNGLTAAHYLAHAGRRVLVLEQAKEPTATPDTGWVPDALIKELGLARRGLVVQQPDPWIAAPLPGGGRLELSQDVARSTEAIKKISPADAAKWPEFCKRMHRLAQVLQQLYTEPAPDVETTDPRELLHLGLVGLRVRRLGRQGMIDLLRVLPMAAAELLDDWFENATLKAILGSAGVMHLRQGPRSGGTAFNMLHHHVGSPAGVFRPARSNVREVLEGLEGVEVRRGAQVARIAVKDGRATGVMLASGEELQAATIVSDADPRATLLGLLDPGWLDPEFALAVKNIKCRGVAARVTLTLERAPDFTTLLVAPSLDYLEHAYDDAKYGRVSANPWLEARADGTKVDVHVQYVPYVHGDDPARAQAVGDVAFDVLTQHAPGLPHVNARQVLTPDGLEQQSGVTEGHLYHGEHTLDQILFMRPVSGWSRYRTPIAGLYLCGAGTHPGGAIAGGSGRNAARAILKEKA
ncbi:MAG TPA: NAD(P)/FAD-dependent oxidoreductase [Gemmatimonadales bacterium]|nr:NAD(P)/FAD-dependent oxidoreductase [Gemmatimonadales bacterium]